MIQCRQFKTLMPRSNKAEMLLKNTAVHHIEVLQIGKCFMPWLYANHRKISTTYGLACWRDNQNQREGLRMDVT